MLNAATAEIEATRDFGVATRTIGQELPYLRETPAQFRATGGTRRKYAETMQPSVPTSDPKRTFPHDHIHWTAMTSREIAALADRISPLLAGHEPYAQGAVLAHLLATWLAGHHVEDDEDATRDARAELLAFHCAQVRKLVAVIDADRGTPASAK